MIAPIIYYGGIVRSKGTQSNFKRI